MTTGCGLRAAAATAAAALDLLRMPGYRGVPRPCSKYVVYSRIVTGDTPPVPVKDRNISWNPAPEVAVARDACVICDTRRQEDAGNSSASGQRHLNHGPTFPLHARLVALNHHSSRRGNYSTQRYYRRIAMRNNARITISLVGMLPTSGKAIKI